MQNKDDSQISNSASIKEKSQTFDRELEEERFRDKSYVCSCRLDSDWNIIIWRTHSSWSYAHSIFQDEYWCVPGCKKFFFDFRLDNN